MSYATFYDLITDELFDKKSLAALVYLIECGRELEFKYNGKEYFISKSKAKEHVSLWGEGKEQSFSHTDELIANAVIDEKSFHSVWNDLTLTYLF